MTNDNRQTEMLESEIMFSLLKKFLEVEFFFFRKMYKDKNWVFFLKKSGVFLIQLQEPIFPFYQNKQKDVTIFLN